MTEREKYKIARLEKNIHETESLLDEWEEQKRLASNPTERKRSQIEIERLQKILATYEDELSALKRDIEAKNVQEQPSLEIKNAQELKENVEQLLHNNQIREALEQMLAFYENPEDSSLKVWIGAQLGRLSQVESDYEEAVITYEQLNSERNRIRKAILGKV